MQTITTIGLDIAKSVFQVHGVDAGGQAIVRRHRSGVRPGVLQEAVAMFVGGRSFQPRRTTWLLAASAAHRPADMPPAYVKPYVKRQKNDATDAEAICEAVTGANMRFVPTKTAEQQAAWCCTARAICSSVSSPR